MKHAYSVIFFLAFLLNGCSDDPETAVQIAEDEPKEFSQKAVEKKIFTEPVVIPIEERADLNSKAKETLKTRMSESPFSELGCCEEEIKQVENCCCSEVLAAYEKMLDAKDKRLAKLNMEDPILNNCKSGYLKADFELLDFGEDEEDELW